MESLAQGRESQAKEMKPQHKETKIRRKEMKIENQTFSICYGKDLASGAPLTLTFRGSR